MPAKKTPCMRCGKKNAHLRNLCDQCLIQTLERRIRRHISFNNLLSPHDRVLVLDPLSKYVLTKLINMPLKVTYKPKADFGIKHIGPETFENAKLATYLSRSKVNKVVLPICLDDYLTIFLENFFHNKGIRPRDIFIFLFENISKEDLDAFCKAKKIRYTFGKEALGAFLDAVEKKHPHTKYAFYNSVKEHEKIKKIASSI